MKMNIECQFWDTITRILGMIQSNDSCNVHVLFLHIYAVLMTFQFKDQVFLIIHWSKQAMPGEELGINLVAT